MAFQLLGVYQADIRRSLVPQKCCIFSNMEKIRQKRETKITLVWTVMGNFHLLEKKLRAGNET
jgi:hypothetical protein